MQDDLNSSESYFQIRSSPESVQLFAADSTVEKDQIHVYKRRWYILVIFGLYSATQNLVWNTWGPISTTAEEAFGWGDSTIAWMSNWGPISYILSGLFFPWLLQVKGLRFSVVVSMALVAVGNLLRIASVHPDKMTPLIHLGQFLNGLAGPIGMAAVSKISVTWFHPEERVTATAISTSLGTLGVALSFVVGPYFVSSQLPAKGFPQSVVIRDLPQDRYLGASQLNNSTIKAAVLYRQMEQEVIWEYLFYEFLWSGILMGVILIHFPSTPPKPPGKSAVAEREEYWTGMRAILRNRPFLTLTFAYAISIGVLSVWASVLNINLRRFNISQETSGQVGFHSMWIGCAASLVYGRFADRLGISMKSLIVLLYVAASLSFVCFLCALFNIIAISSTAVICLTVIAGSTFLNASTPLMYELACEMVYPIGEATPIGIMTLLNNVAGIVFLTSFSFRDVGTMWMNWTLVVAVVTCIPLVMTLNVTYRRRDLEGPAQRSRVKAI